MSNRITPSMILHEPRVAFEGYGFVCPLKHGVPHDWWLVLRVLEGRVQLTPLSPHMVNDDDREGVCLGTVPIILSTGERSYPSTYFLVTRWLSEIDPPDAHYAGNLASARLHALPDGFQRVLEATRRWGIPLSSGPPPNVNWHGLWYVRGLLASEAETNGDSWKTYTVRELINQLDSYDPPVVDGKDAVVRASIRAWLQDTAAQYGLDYPACYLSIP